MSNTEYKFKKGEQVRLTKDLDWVSSVSPRVGDTGMVIAPGIVTTRVGFSLKAGVVAVATHKLERV